MLTIRNNRPHRIFFNTMGGDLEELMSQLTKKDAEGPYHQAPLSEAVLFLTILEGRVLDPGEEIKITAPADRETRRGQPAKPE